MTLPRLGWRLATLHFSRLFSGVSRTRRRKHLYPCVLYPAHTSIYIAVAMQSVLSRAPPPLRIGIAVVVCAVTAGSFVGLGHLTGGTAGNGVGFLCVVLAILGFGSNFVVIKGKGNSPGDGFFFQLNLCVAIWLAGLLFHLGLATSTGFAPPFQPLAMLGGALWATGNVAVPFIVDTIGLALGLLVWGTCNMLTGWASGHFGILGVAKQTVQKPTLNIIGVCIAIISLVVYGTIKSENQEDDEVHCALCCAACCAALYNVSCPACCVTRCIARRTA